MGWWEDLSSALGLTPTVTNKNPYTEQILAQMLGNQGLAQGGMSTGYGNMESLINQGLAGYNTQGMQNAYGGMGSLVGSALGGFNTQGMQGALGGMGSLVGSSLGGYDPSAVTRAYGNMGNLAASSMNAYNPGNFLNQFLNQNGGLGQLANQDYSSLMSSAKQVGEQAVQDVAGQFAGLGSLYSGGAAQEATKALAQPMFAAEQQAQAQRAAMLQNLYGSAMSGLQQGNIAGMQGGLQAAGLQGQAMSPLLQAQALPMQAGLQGAGLFGQGANTMLQAQLGQMQGGLQGAGLFGQAMNPMLQGSVAGLQGALQGAGLFGQQGAANAGLLGNINQSLAGYGTPQNSANQTWWQGLQGLIGTGASAAGGLAALGLI